MMSGEADILLKGGYVIDPAQGIDGLADVAVKDGRIAAVSADAGRAKETIDVTGKLVIPGMIDTHAHVFQHIGGPFGLNADMVGVQSGVTTLVDQGGPSSMTFAGFRHYIVEPAKTNVLAFISAYVVGGLEGHYYTELYSPDGVDVRATCKVIDANRDLAKGIKAHAEIGGFARWGMTVMEMAKEISKTTGLPLYIHLGQLWPMPEGGEDLVDPDTIIPQVVDLMTEGDVLAVMELNDDILATLKNARLVSKLWSEAARRPPPVPVARAVSPSQSLLSCSQAAGRNISPPM